ncbi:MAG TPA: hypothetical protein VEA40_22560 [Ramlibacter sp.]|nr:hypothetical protein [Ramlibacter sp.]
MGGLLTAAAGPVRTAMPSAPVLGVNALWIPGDLASLQSRFRKARALGVREVRLDWEWRQAEEQPGVYRWDKFDLLVQAAADEGVALLPIVHYAPAWAVRGERKRADVYEMAPREETFGAYANFLLACIGRYGPGGNAGVRFTPIRHWQVWNEPNLPQFWGPQPEPKAFAALLRRVAGVVAPLRRQVQIVHAGLSKPDLEFMWQLWDANPLHGETFDVMAVHPYLYDGRAGIRAPDVMDADDSKAGQMGFVGSVKDPGFLGKVFNLQLFMQLRGAKDKPIWITEMGYFVGPHRFGVNEQGQAERLARTLDFIRTRLTSAPYGSGLRALAANVQRVYWFSLEDYPSPEGLGSFGLYRPDGSMRPAGQVLRQYVR